MTAGSAQGRGYLSDAQWSQEEGFSDSEEEWGMTLVIFVQYHGLWEYKCNCSTFLAASLFHGYDILEKFITTLVLIPYNMSVKWLL